MSETPVAIAVQNLSKSFKLPHEQSSGIKQLVVNFKKRKKGYETQRVLNDVSFEIKKGEFFGIVGRNGSGKSTLLKLLAGIYTPDSGGVQVNGSLTPFIELGVGFNPELTGRENVFLNGALLGFGKKEMEVMYDDIVNFAELERFMDQKLKNYSSGMQVRLAFSIAVRANSDILLLDEVLAVGDSLFQQKCFEYFKQLKMQKKTVILVSHDRNALLEFCDKGVLIEAGELVFEGSIDKVVDEYTKILNKNEELSDDSVGQEEQRNTWGTGQGSVGPTETYDTATANKTKLFTDEHDFVGISVDFKANEDLEEPVYGITITDSTGQRIFDSNTMWLHMTTQDLKKNSTVTVKWKLPNFFNTGTYHVSPAIANSTGTETYEWFDDKCKFKVRKQLVSTTSINIAHRVSIE